MAIESKITYFVSLSNVTNSSPVSEGDLDQLQLNGQDSTHIICSFVSQINFHTEMQWFHRDN